MVTVHPQAQTPMSYIGYWLAPNDAPLNRFVVSFDSTPTGEFGPVDGWRHTENERNHDEK